MVEIGQPASNGISSGVRYLLMGTGIIILLGGLGYGGYRLLKKQDILKSDAKVIMDGQERSAEFLTEESKGAEESLPENRSAAVEEARKSIEDKADEGISYEEYLSLAQSYMSSGNAEKALENYRLAKETAPKNMEGYNGFVEAMDEMIAQMERIIESS